MKATLKSTAVFILLIVCWDSKTNCRLNNFNTRTSSEWRRLWHTEHHRRCYRDLISHMEITCSNDIYKLSKRSLQQPPLKINEVESPVEKRSVNSLRRVKRGIMEECCSVTGCSWEEYAEYCPTNRRIRTKK